MENYAKVVLYSYPLLKTVGKDYEDHIRNKAILSYTGNVNTERLAEYLAEEILRKEKLEWLKTVIERIFQSLDEEERALLAIRYFGRSDKLKKWKAGAYCPEGKKAARSERQYFRLQNRLSEKVGAMLKRFGVTEETFEKEYAPIDIFRRLKKLVDEGKDSKASRREKRAFEK